MFPEIAFTDTGDNSDGITTNSEVTFVPPPDHSAELTEYQYKSLFALDEDLTTKKLTNRTLVNGSIILYDQAELPRNSEVHQITILFKGHSNSYDFKPPIQFFNVPIIILPSNTGDKNDQFTTNTVIKIQPKPASFSLRLTISNTNNRIVTKDYNTGSTALRLSDEYEAHINIDLLNINNLNLDAGDIITAYRLAYLGHETTVSIPSEDQLEFITKPTITFKDTGKTDTNDGYTTNAKITIKPPHTGTVLKEYTVLTAPSFIGTTVLRGFILIRFVVAPVTNNGSINLAGSALSNRAMRLEEELRELKIVYKGDTFTYDALTENIDIKYVTNLEVTIRGIGGGSTVSNKTYYSDIEIEFSGTDEVKFLKYQYERFSNASSQPMSVIFGNTNTPLENRPVLRTNRVVRYRRDLMRRNLSSREHHIRLNRIYYLYNDHVLVYTFETSSPYLIERR